MSLAESLVEPLPQSMVEALPGGADGPSGPGAGVDNLLLETGDNFLLETGDALLLE